MDLTVRGVEPYKEDAVEARRVRVRGQPDAWMSAGRPLLQNKVRTWVPRLDTYGS